jgi:succinate dehydrogenase hydrophobic anchor subunit
VTEVFASLVRDPYHHLVKRWNWKSALTSMIVRGSIFFAANLAAGLGAAVGAMLADFSFRGFVAGVYGSVTQSLRKAEPVWAATLSAIVVLPLTSHAIEFLVHWLRGTPRLATSIEASIAFTVLSTLFNLYAMRHGVLLVDDAEKKSLARDFAMMPRVVAGFIAFGPVLVWRAARRKAWPPPLM